MGSIPILISEIKRQAVCDDEVHHKRVRYQDTDSYLYNDTKQKIHNTNTDKSITNFNKLEFIFW